VANTYQLHQEGIGPGRRKVNLHLPHPSPGGAVLLYAIPHNHYEILEVTAVEGPSENVAKTLQVRLLVLVPSCDLHPLRVCLVFLADAVIYTLLGCVMIYTISGCVSLML